MAVPEWIQHEGIISLLVSIIRKLDKQPAESRKNSIYISTSDKWLKGLRVPDYDGEEDFLWSQIETLINHNVFTFKQGRRKGHDPVWANGKLEFNFDAEDTIRVWTEMPRAPDLTPWEEALRDHAANIDVIFLADKELSIVGRDPGDIVQRLEQTRDYLIQINEPRTLRQLSARFLWGASKALDSRGENWLANALDIPRSLIKTRPINAQVQVGEEYSGRFLFIENLDTFNMLCDSRAMDEYALIYLSGFLVTAGRIRQIDLVKFFFSAKSSPDHQASFLDAWFGHADIPCSIWGDLDYAGLSIASSLRQQFPALDWWEPGYTAMLLLLNNDVGHPVTDTTKGAQIPPDEALMWGFGLQALSSIKNSDRFVDQEAVLPETLDFI